MIDRSPWGDFDAYGPLLDVQGMMQPVFRQAFGVPAEGIGELWRRKYHEYTLMRTVIDRYVDYWQVATDALVYAARHHGHELSADDCTAILAHYYHVRSFGDTKHGLTLLSAYKKALVSNGNASMISSMLQVAELNDAFDGLVSSDQAGTFKPHARMYALGLERLKVPVEHAVFVSSNSWDVIGAQELGLKGIWLRRTAGLWEELGAAPNDVIGGLDKLSPLLATIT